jgi:cytochrome c556
MRYTTLHLALFVAVLFLAAIPRLAFSQHPANSHLSDAATVQTGANPLIEEMTLLDRAFRDIVSAVSLGDTAAVHKALEPLHGTMEKTHNGVRAGRVTLRRNAGRIKEFKTMDLAFHAKLEALSRAAQHKNNKEMLRITKLLLEGCVQCHSKFRP